MNLKLALFAVVCVLAFTLTKAVAVPAGVKEDDFAPPPPAMLEVEGRENNDGIGKSSGLCGFSLFLFLMLLQNPQKFAIHHWSHFVNSY